MPARRPLRGTRGSRRLRRRLKAWQEDREQHAAARTEARARAPLRPGERLLAVARSAGGGLLAATDWALYHQTGQAWVRVAWDQLGRADWDEQRHVLVLTGLTPTVPARTVLRLAKDWGLPAVAAERVGWAKVVDQRISLNGGDGARVVARRLPSDAHVTWLVIPDPGLDPGDPRVRAELKPALTELRAVTGVEGSADSEPGLAQPW